MFFAKPLIVVALRFHENSNICTYGPLHILTVLSSIAATALTYYATFDCHFLETTTPLEAFANLDAEFGFRRGVGVWTLEVDGKCQGWSSDEELDIPTVVARVFTMVVCIFSLMLHIMLMVPCCSMVGGTAYMQKLGQFLLIMGVLYPLSFVRIVVMNVVARPVRRSVVLTNGLLDDPQSRYLHRCIRM
jgi:hypothetical protein